MRDITILLLARIAPDGSLQLVHSMPGDTDVFAFPPRDLTAEEAVRACNSLPLWVIGRAGQQAALAIEK
jgi:hypothetical protein